MMTWTNVDLNALSSALPDASPPSAPTSAIMYSFSSPLHNNSHVHTLTSGSIYLPTRLTLSDTFLFLLRRLHSLGFTNGILECLAVFWVIVGFTIGALWGLSTYIKHRERRARYNNNKQQTLSQAEDETGENVLVEIKVSRRRPSNLSLAVGSNRSICRRSALSSPERRASCGLVSPKSVRWAEQLTSHEPACCSPPEYGQHDVFQDPDAGLTSCGSEKVEEADITTSSSPTAPYGRMYQSAAAYKSDRVRRVVAKLKTGGSSQSSGFDQLNDIIIALEGDVEERTEAIIFVRGAFPQLGARATAMGSTL